MRMKISAHKRIATFFKGIQTGTSCYNKTKPVFVIIIEALQDIFPFWSFVNFVETDPFCLDCGYKIRIFEVQTSDLAAIPVEIGLVIFAESGPDNRGLANLSGSG